jgi:hypothetical protein
MKPLTMVRVFDPLLKSIIQLLDYLYRILLTLSLLT